MGKADAREEETSRCTIYDALVRTAVHAVKADTVASFLRRKLTAAYSGELGNGFHTRIHGTRIIKVDW